MQQTFVFDDASPGTSLAALGMELGSHLTVDAVVPRGPAAARGVGLGMRLVACGDVSTLGTPLDAVAEEVGGLGMVGFSFCRRSLSLSVCASHLGPPAAASQQKTCCW